MIICAAVKFRNIHTNEDLIVLCHRHHNGYEFMRDANLRSDYFEVDEGFINHKNEYLNRKDALTHALDCGQLSAEVRHIKVIRNEDELYSEDLY